MVCKMLSTLNKDEIINELMERGFLVGPDFFDNINDGFDVDDFCEKIKKLETKPLVLTNEVLFSVFNQGLRDEEKLNKVELIPEEKEDKVVIIKSYKEEKKKKEVNDFVDYFRARYNSLKNILMNRPELQNAISINRILNKPDKGNVALIGIVRDKATSKNGNIILTLEDITGEMKVLVNKNKPELFESVNDIQLDEVIGVVGVNSDKIVFVNDILFPDIPINNELKKSDKEEYIVFTSDIHLGSKVFFEKNFLRFISWLNGNYGSEEHKEIAKKVKYLFIAGDLVEGVGIYPDQERDLAIQDIYEQYNKLTEYISMIKKDINIIIIGGNHDALRLSEPQPVIDKKMAPSLYELENITFVTNPSTVNVSSRGGFVGFNVLLYHGGSFPFLSENVDSIRRNGRLDRPDLIMRYLLQRRHLAVSHTSTLYVPGGEDHLVIDKVPDFFISGHIHKTVVGNYRNVTMIGCGCWTDQTENQEKRGIVPDPNRAILVNLQTREPKILNFEE